MNTPIGRGPPTEPTHPAERNLVRFEPRERAVPGSKKTARNGQKFKSFTVDI